jgi:hypothetical protein
MIRRSLRLRTLILLVAVIAAAMAPPAYQRSIWRYRERQYTRRAADHAQIVVGLRKRDHEVLQEDIRELMKEWHGPKRGADERDRIEAQMPYARHLRRIAWHDSMRVKYEKAASQPWIAVEPDPPLPE